MEKTIRRSSLSFILLDPTCKTIHEPYITFFLSHLIILIDGSNLAWDHYQSEKGEKQLYTKINSRLNKISSGGGEEPPPFDHNKRKLPDDGHIPIRKRGRKTKLEKQADDEILAVQDYVTIQILAVLHYYLCDLQANGFLPDHRMMVYAMNILLQYMRRPAVRDVTGLIRRENIIDELTDRFMRSRREHDEQNILRSSCQEPNYTLIPGFSGMKPISTLPELSLNRGPRTPPNPNSFIRMVPLTDDRKKSLLTNWHEDVRMYVHPQVIEDQPGPTSWDTLPTVTIHHRAEDDVELDLGSLFPKIVGSSDPFIPRRPWLSPPPVYVPTPIEQSEAGPSGTQITPVDGSVVVKEENNPTDTDSD